MQNFRGARTSAREALREFNWFEYRPFAWIMAVQLAFLFMASNLGSDWGMTGAGWIMRLTTGEAGLHYPSSFVVLLNAHSLLESSLYTVVGSFLIPLSLIRVHARATGSSPTGALARSRVRKAYAPTLCSFLVNIGIVLLWQYIEPLGPRKWVHAFLAGQRGDVASWLLGIVVSLVIATVFLYVPVRGIGAGTSFRDDFVGGIGEGVRALGPTLFIVAAFAWPTLLFLAPLQLSVVTIVTKMSPEVVLFLIAAAAIVNSFVNYLIYSATARLHWLGLGKED